MIGARSSRYTPMRARFPKLKWMKHTRAKGKDYFYFRTGTLDERGKEILKPLPHFEDPDFWPSYGSHKGARTKRANVSTELTFPQLCDLWEKSPRWTMKKGAKEESTNKKGGKKRERPYAEGTKKIYGISLAYARKQLPTAPAALVEQQDIARLVDERADQPGAANSILRTIKSLYKWARSRGHVPQTCDPCGDIEELETGEHEPWPEHIVEAALAADDERIRVGVHLLYFTGQRIEDVVNMLKTDRQWRQPQTDVPPIRVLHVIQQKGGTELDVREHQRLTAELDKHPTGLDYILTGASRGKPIHQNTLRDSIQAWVKKRHGITVVPHGLRKNAVNALLEAGCSAAETAAITGQSLQTIEHYAKKRAQGKLASAAILKWQANK